MPYLNLFGPQTDGAIRWRRLQAVMAWPEDPDKAEALYVSLCEDALMPGQPLEAPGFQRGLEMRRSREKELEAFRDRARNGYSVGSVLQLMCADVPDGPLSLGKAQYVVTLSQYQTSVEAIRKHWKALLPAAHLWAACVLVGTAPTPLRDFLSISEGILELALERKMRGYTGEDALRPGPEEKIQPTRPKIPVPSAEILAPLKWYSNRSGQERRKAAEAERAPE